MGWECEKCGVAMEQQVLVEVCVRDNPLVPPTRAYICLCQECRRRVSVALGRDPAFLDTDAERKAEDEEVDRG